MRDGGFNFALKGLLAAVLLSLLAGPLAAHPGHQHVAQHPQDPQDLAASKPVQASDATKTARALLVHLSVCRTGKGPAVFASQGYLQCHCCTGCPCAVGCTMGTACGTAACGGSVGHALLAFCAADMDSRSLTQRTRFQEAALPGHPAKPLDRPPRT